MNVKSINLKNILYPFSAESESRHSVRSLRSRKPRAIQGISVDPISGDVFVLESNYGHSMRLLLHRLSCERLLNNSIELENIHCRFPGGIAFDCRDNSIWVSDRRRNVLYQFSSAGKFIRELNVHRLGIDQIGAISFDDKENRILAVDEGARRIVHLSNTDQFQSYTKLPIDLAGNPTGITPIPNSENHCMVAFLPDIPEQDGIIGDHFLAEISPDGQLVRRLSTENFGFCARDITISKNNTLIAASREFVLPETPGDHSHLFVLDFCPANNPIDQPNAVIVEYFLRHNVAFDTQLGKRNFRKWHQQPVPVYPVGLIDLEISMIQSALNDWMAASAGALRFEVVGQKHPYGITILQEGSSVTLGRPGLNETVIVSVSTREQIGSFPNEISKSSAQLNILRHEIGHAIGFTGHSPRFHLDTMNSISGFSASISKEESEFVRCLYSDMIGDWSIDDIYLT